MNNIVQDVSTHASRLRSERKRLGFTQAKLAADCHVAKPTQIGYEQGLRKPDIEYLSRALEAGLDVHFLLSGVTDEEHVFEKVDWKLLAEIITGVVSWCERNDGRVLPGQWERVLRYFYKKYRAEKRVDFAEMDQVLGLAA